MNRRRARALTGTVLAFALLMQACARTERYGEVTPGSGTTAVKEILSRPQEYRGKTVRVEGRIVTECPTGCWFEMKEDGAVLYVDIGRQGLAIPQRLGRKVAVEGTVAVDGAIVKLEGRGVEIR